MIINVRHGRVTSQIISPAAAASNVIRRTVPASARTYDPQSGKWTIFGSQIGQLIAAFRERGFDVVEIGGAA